MEINMLILTYKALHGLGLISVIVHLSPPAISAPNGGLSKVPIDIKERGGYQDILCEGSNTL